MDLLGYCSRPRLARNVRRRVARNPGPSSTPSTPTFGSDSPALRASMPMLSGIIGGTSRAITDEWQALKTTKHSLSASALKSFSRLFLGMI
jgi:hypothetical protein